MLNCPHVNGGMFFPLKILLFSEAPVVSFTEYKQGNTFILGFHAFNNDLGRISKGSNFKIFLTRSTF